MKSFHEWLEERNENYMGATAPTGEVNHEFLQAVGEARQKLAEMHKTLQRNKDPQYQKGLVSYMKNARANLSQLLMPFDRKPVAGNTEFRMANQGSLQQLAMDNRMGQDMIEKSILNGQIDELIQTVVSAEKTLGDWFKSSSPRNAMLHQQSPSMIDHTPLNNHLR
jgi:hypothetical protein